MRFYTYNYVAPTALAAGRGQSDGKSASLVRGEIFVETNRNPLCAPSGATYSADHCQILRCAYLVHHEIHENHIPPSDVFTPVFSD